MDNLKLLSTFVDSLDKKAFKDLFNFTVEDDRHSYNIRFSDIWAEEWKSRLQFAINFCSG